MKTFVAVIAGIAILLLLFVMFAPRDRLDIAQKMVEGALDSDLRAANDCLAAIAYKYKYPGSVELVSHRVDDSIQRVFIQVDAPNDLGAKVRKEESCPLDSSGNFKDSAARMEKMWVDSCDGRGSVGALGSDPEACAFVQALRSRNWETVLDEYSPN